MIRPRGNPDDQFVCKSCSRIIDKKTGEVVRGWENAKFVTGDGLKDCMNCEEKKLWPTR